MTTVTLKGTPFETVGELPAVGQKAPEFSLTKDDLSELTLADLSGRVVLNIFPSVDTPTCAMSVRQFNTKAAALDNTTVVCVSKDLPFAMARFCGAEGIDNVVTGSAFRSSFAEDYGLLMKNGPLAGLCSRVVVVIDETGKVIYTEQVSEIADEPDYEKALSALS
ncbi:MULTISPECIES: thiol peroxidase [unclassified Methylophaga]|mgnify:CR=1 FL=1|jgi:thiol peroxidase|uniref:thiol peroxidase n=1 Tax=unclassified Methylophaga TaxID=2629249 RepID=UPI00259C77B4|nr:MULTISPECIES: thiol peroxidase [unclassified Methylophaga]|tara:strand:- start:402 stop:896 length:495 start_codon:yes stop_codon:yes gene_type:complete